MPFLREAANLSRMRSPMISRSNCAKESRMLSVILAAIGDAERTVADLEHIIRQNPCFRTIEPLRLRRAIIDRLNMLKAQGHIVDMDPKRGPRGSLLRVVAKPTKNAPPGPES